MTRPACHTGECAPDTARHPLREPAGIPPSGGLSPIPRAFCRCRPLRSPHRHVLGGTMRHTAVMLAVVCLALAGCSSGSGKSDAAAPAVTVTTTAPAATPSLSHDEVIRLCSVAVSEAAPGWEDWNFDPGEWPDDPRTPEPCLALEDADNAPRGNRAFMQALLDGLESADDPRARS